MKEFFAGSALVETAPGSGDTQRTYIGSRARVAVYDGPASAPRVEEVGADTPGEYIEAISSRVYELSQQQGGGIPYTAVREVAENLIHAGFAEPVISVLDQGNTIRFADQGPGITDKEHAILPGFTTATGEMKRFIRGVGSGLPIVRDYLSVSGGDLIIEDNLGRGAVVTIRSNRMPVRPTAPAPGFSNQASTAMPFAHQAPSQSAQTGSSPAQISLAVEHPAEETLAAPRLTNRQKQVLALVMESGSAGPSIVARELSVAISTAYRDLASLEELGLITADGGKRTLTEDGMRFLDDLLTSL